MTKELQDAITSIQRLETSPGWLDRNIQEAKKSLPPTEAQLAAARLAGKIEGMEMAAQICDETWDYEEIPDAIRAKITELKKET